MATETNNTRKHNISKDTNFYEQLDTVFDILYERYGFIDDIINLKSDLLYVYENENSWKSQALLKLIKPKQWYIDENGCIKSVPSK